MPRDELEAVEQLELLAERERLGHRDRQERREVLVELDRLDSLVAVDYKVLRVALEQVDKEE